MTTIKRSQSSKNRALQHQKGFRVHIGEGSPKNSEGNDGEFTLRTTKSGLKLFCKYKNKWYSIGEQSLRQSSGAELDEYNQNSQGATTINSRTGNLNMGGAIAMAGARPRGGLMGYASDKTSSLSFPINASGATTGGLCFESTTEAAYFDNVHVKLESDKRLYFNGDDDNDTYITGGDNNIDFLVGASTKLQLDTSTTPDLMRLTNADLYLTSNLVSATGNNELIFLTQRGATPAAGQDGDDLGRISFKGYNDAGTPELFEYAYMHAEIDDASDGTEDGKLTIGLDSRSNSNIKFTNSQIEFMIGTFGPMVKFDYVSNNTDFFTTADADDYFRIDVNNHGATHLKTHDDSGANSADLRLNPQGDLLLDSTLDMIFDAGNGNFIAKNSGTEFSAANSSYAGMILGATEITYTTGAYQATTTSHANIMKNFDSADHYLKVSFVVPPSNRVKIKVFLPYCVSCDGLLELGLATDTSATALDTKYNNFVWDVDESDGVMVNQEWNINGADHSWSAGQSKTLYCTIKEGTAGGRIFFGKGVSTTYYGSWIMEAIALPSTISDGT